MLIALLIIKGAYEQSCNRKPGTPEPLASPSPTSDIGHLPTPTPVIHGTLPPANQAEIRERLRNSYEITLQQASPSYNYIQAKIVKGRKGYELYGVHDFYNEYSFSAGSLARKVEDWIDTNRGQLKTANIVRVGVKGGGRGESTWFDVE